MVKIHFTNGEVLKLPIQLSFETMQNTASWQTQIFQNYAYLINMDNVLYMETDGDFTEICEEESE